MAGPLTIAYLADPNSVHTRRWIGFFAERGHRVHLLVPHDGEVRPGLHPGVALERYRALRPRLPLMAGVMTGPAVRAALRPLRPDVVHAHWLTSHGWLARLAGIRPLVLTPWGSDLLVAPRRSPLARLRLRATLAGADLVTCNSRHLADEAVRAGARSERVEVVRFGVDTDRFAPGPPDPALRRRLGLPDGPLLLSPRAIQPLYRHEVALEAVRALPPDTVMVMSALNATPDERARVDRLIGAHGLEGRVVILDRIDEPEMVALLREAVALVSVPESDALPMTVLEAMACGTPVVTTDHPALRELIEPVAPASLVPVGDVEAVTRALAVLISLDDEGRRSLGSRMRDVVLAEAEQRACMERMETLYRAVSRRP